MSALLDSSVLVAALASDELKHAECLAILLKGGNCIYSHALLETFSTLTGGKLGVRVTADFAARMLSETVLPRVAVIEVSSEEARALIAGGFAEQVEQSGKPEATEPAPVETAAVEPGYRAVRPTARPRKTP